ncbi:MAG: hypothetical protein R8M46_05785 [Ghiorsea sp.]
MALPVLPSNGFITRLLQQTKQAPTITSSTGGEKTAAKPDQATISNEARQANKNPGNAPQLESKLIELYNKNGQSQG